MNAYDRGCCCLQFVNNALSSHWADEDDMLFAVFRNPAGKKAFTALRRVPGVLPKDLMYGSDMYNSIDWKASVLLNLAMHARYTLTLTVGGYNSTPPLLPPSGDGVLASVFGSPCHPFFGLQQAQLVRCRHDEIVAALRTGLGLTGTASASSESTAITNALQKRAFNIHPRLSRIPVDSSGRYVKVSEPDNTFPYLAFSVDDFDDDAVEPLVLWEPTDEFAVTLHVRFQPLPHAQPLAMLPRHTSYLIDFLDLTRMSHVICGLGREYLLVWVKLKHLHSLALYGPHKSIQEGGQAWS